MLQSPDKPHLERAKARSVDHSSEREKMLKSKTSAVSLSAFPSATPTTTDSPYKTSEFYIIRVSVDTNGPETEGLIVFLSLFWSALLKNYILRSYHVQKHHGRESRKNQRGYSQRNA